MVDSRLSISPFCNKVLNVIKAKYDLPDKSAALNKFAEIYGRLEVEKNPDDELWRALSKLKSPKNELSAKEKKKVAKALEGKEASYIFGRLGLKYP